MADIHATRPVVVPATGSVTYDKWFMTSFNGKYDDKKGITYVTLHRVNVDNNGKMTFMPDGPDSDISISLDVWKEVAGTPEIGVALTAIVNAIIAYGTKNNVL